MKIFELTTGFVAALMIVLGTAFHVNKNGTVAEDTATVDTTAVVEEVSARIAAIKQDCVWYQYTGVDFSNPAYSTQIKDSSQYLIFSSDPEISPECPGTLQICAVCLPNSGDDNPDQADLQAIEALIDAGQAVPGLIMVKD